MLVLGIETSCDDTSAAVVEDGARVLSNVVYNQNTIHARYGGVVPELAGRAHIERVHLAITEALTAAGVTLQEVDLVAVTRGPGLAGSLLVGVNAAKGIGYGLRKPVVGVNHLEGHLLAIFLQEPVEFPFVALIASGGHTELCRVDGFCRYTILGRTRDDAAGESFDKTAKMLGYGYPGGPVIEKLAGSGRAARCHFPRAFLEKDSLDFSFSGLKTAVRNFLGKRAEAGAAAVGDEDVAAGFQEAVTEVLTVKLIAACQAQNLRRAVVTGGVAVNGRLRQKLGEAAAVAGISAHFPHPAFCSDNAAMIACAGYHRHRLEPADFLSMDAQPNMPL